MEPRPEWNSSGEGQRALDTPIWLVGSSKGKGRKINLKPEPTRTGDERWMLALFSKPRGGGVREVSGCRGQSGTPER